jgi:aminoglycoside phosphotransferase (APT) family kinase protein
VPDLIKSLDGGDVRVSEHEDGGPHEDDGPTGSPEPILGPTQRALTAAGAARIVHASLGPGRQVVQAMPLTGGGFATVWRADLDDDTSVVLKVGPAPDAPLLTYEADMVGAEAGYLRTVRRGEPTVPVPEVLHHGDDPDVIDGSWLVLQHLPGTALAGLRESLAEDQQAAVRYELGQTLARVHRIDGNVFGYPGAGRRQAATWREAYLGIIDDLLADAVRLAQELPLPPAWIRDVLGEASEALTAVVRPALVHFDLWDGNVLTAPDADGRWHLTGLVDGERSLYADPLVDFVSPELFGRIEDDPDHPFAVGYAAQAGPEFKLDAEARRRILLYRAWFYLLMRVEFPTRLISEEHQKQRDDMLREVLLAVRGDGP